MRLLITGVSGMLGHRLAIEATKKNYKVFGTYHRRPVRIKNCSTCPLDITEAKETEKVVQEIKPDVIIHTAALTNVDFCEDNPGIALKVNAEGTMNVCRASAERGIKVVYISTDFVFDGTKGFYSEKDLPNPLSAYARSKFEGENEVAKLPDYLIIRATIFGWHLDAQKSVPEWVIDNLQKNQPIKAFADRIITPIYTGYLSQIILTTLEKRLSGLFHIGCQPSISIEKFAIKVAEVFSLDRSLIYPGKMNEVGLKAKRPKNSSLNPEKIERALRIKMPSVCHNLEQMKNERGLAKEWIS